MTTTIKDIINRLLTYGFEAYIVGGAVRDFLLNRTPSDIDIATDARPRQIISLFEDANVNTVGKSFGVILVDGVEVATFRKDRFAAEYNAKSCKPSFSNRIEDDLSRRDLTINALALDCRTDAIIDLFNGADDLSKGIIRFVNNPIERIKEDPDRIIRACRFFASCGNSFDRQTFEAMSQMAYTIPKYVHPDRIRKEIMKALLVEYPSLFFCALHTIDALKYIFKGLDNCFNHEHGLHHIETIGEHSMLAGDYLSPNDPILRLAGYLHDVGKPYTFDGGKFIQHERYGSNIVRKELKHLMFSNEDINRISNLVYVHMRQCRGLTKSSARRLRKHFYDLNVNPRDFIRLKLADRMANIKNDKNRMSMIKPMLVNTGIVAVEENLPMTVKDLALKGGEIMKLFCLNPGPKIGYIQKALLDYVVTYGEERNNREHLIDIARLYL